MSYAQQACREYAFNVGQCEPEREWINTPLDSWERNPFYHGKPGRHSEDWYEAEEILDTDEATLGEDLTALWETTSWPPKPPTPLLISEFDELPF